MLIMINDNVFHAESESGGQVVSKVLSRSAQQPKFLEGSSNVGNLGSRPGIGAAA